MTILNTNEPITGQVLRNHISGDGVTKNVTAPGPATGSVVLIQAAEVLILAEVTVKCGGILRGRRTLKGSCGKNTS